jgi:hypothetical protein
VLRHYNESGLLQMILQEFIEWDHFVRCICLGRDEVLPIRYDPRERATTSSTTTSAPELGAASSTTR